MDYNKETYRLSGDTRLTKLPLIIGIVGLALSAIGYSTNHEQFFHSYLTSYIFWLSIGWGGLFFTMIHHLTGAVWSVVIRRISETLMMTIPWMALLFLPLIPGLHDLYHWTHTAEVAHDVILQKKASYLNISFFLIRAAGYFIVWIVLSNLLYKKSLKQDEDGAKVGSFLKISAPGMILFGFTVTFASFDWLMSLNPHWYSTIYGVYIFSGGVMAMFASIAIVATYLQSRGILKETITTVHYHDLGKLLFAFMIFWAYMAFSQYFLIWYANIPEETVWFADRWKGSWKTVSLLIVFGHFVIPFFALISQAAKRNPVRLSLIALWLLLMHWVDLYWNVVPTLHPDSAHISWMDLTTMVGIGGIFLWLFWRRLLTNPLVPTGDPNLQKSIKFVS